MSFNGLVSICILYVAVLFAVAFWADKRAERGQMGWLRSPFVYTLSLSIYCTAWTFYGAVGNAARSGLEFVTIYLGPSLVMFAWWVLLRRLVRVGRTQRTTSIADLISSRYGKSNNLGVLVTLLAVVGVTPYIALQLQSVTLSFDVFATDGDSNLRQTAFFVALGLAAFAILFGTRNLDVNAHHHGVVTAIAIEAIVKLVALLSVGVFVVFYVGGGVTSTLAAIDASQIGDRGIEPARWTVLIFLSAMAIICLPRMFQVMVVENPSERHLATASWAFPLYLLAMSLFVVPIAVYGQWTMPDGANPDLFVLTVPLAYDRDGLALLAFLGGFSSATSMVIVAAIAVSTMVANHIIMPIWLNTRTSGATVSGDVRYVVITSRRISIGVVVGLGYLYYVFSGGGAALAAMGLISFTGMAQVVPALLGGLFWRGATRVGAAAGLSVGFAIWLWTSFLPSFGAGGLMPMSVMIDGPFGLSFLRPQALFGLEGLDPLVHAVFWSLLLNSAAFCLCSILTFPTPVERVQAATFVNILRHSGAAPGWTGSDVEAEELLMMSQRILGASQAQRLFEGEAEQQGKIGYLPDVSPGFLEKLERELAGSVGAATAHAMITQSAGGVSVSVEDLLRVADEAQQILEYSHQLEAKSQELGRTALQLQEANEKLVALSVQKDGFLSQISHELRTPMTSIRSFSEFLLAGDLPKEQRRRYSRIIHDETKRLTRLLDDLLDLSVLENGQVTLYTTDVALGDVIDQAVAATDLPNSERPLAILRNPENETIALHTDSDRLAQVFINLISNAQKYCDAEQPELLINVGRDKSGAAFVDFIDNGSGIPVEAQSVLFEKFARGTDEKAAGGAGLGLAICREVMLRIGGSIAYVPGEGGAAFRLILPGSKAKAA